MANPKKLVALLSLMLLFACGETRAQNFNFLPDDLVQQTSSASIKNWLTANSYPASYSGPYNFPATNHDMYAYLIPGPPAYTQCQLWTPFVYKSLQDYVKVKIDKNCVKNISQFKYRFAFTVTTYSLPALTGNTGNNISGTPGTMSTTQYNPTITLSYDPASGASFQDVGVFKVSGGHRIDVSLTSVTNLQTNTVIPLNQLPDCISFETVVSTQRMDNIGTAKPEVNNVTVTDGALNLSWGFPCAAGGYKVQPKGVEYELEWTYVDDYLKTDFDHPVNTNGQENNRFTASGSNIDKNIYYSFDGNATRVRVRTLSYSIPIVYERGAIVYRIRTLRPNTDNYEEVVYGDWTLPSSGTIDPVNDAQFSKKAFILDAQNNYYNGLNWQYTINFAEEGKYKHVINYLDGALKNRQTQTKINSNNNYIIAVDRAFDYEGRPEITSLPVPVAGQNKLGYKDNILVNPATSMALNAADFDNRGNSPTSCAVPAVIPPSLAVQGSTAPSLAEQYYSSANPLVNDPLHKFIPQSEGYPYMQTVLAPENSEKVLAQGGAGPAMQVYAGGHPVSYSYVRPVTEELDRVLGTEAGAAAFYPKTLTIDPNGQGAVSIVNKYGKPVVSCLSGASPASMQALNNNATPASITSDLLKTAHADNDGIVSHADGSFSLDAASPLTLTYSATIKPFMVCGSPTTVFNPNTGQWVSSYTNSKFLQLPATVNITLADACGGGLPFVPNSSPSFVQSFGSAAILSGQSQQGNPALNPPASVSYNSTTTYFNLLSISNPLQKGAYSYTKELRFDKNKMEELADQLIDDNPALFAQSSGACSYRTQEDFVREQVEGITASCAPPAGSGAATDPCDALRKKMKEELYPGAKYGGYKKDAFGHFSVSTGNSIFDRTGITSTGAPVPPCTTIALSNGAIPLDGSNVTGSWSTGTGNTYVFHVTGGSPIMPAQNETAALSCDKGCDHTLQFVSAANGNYTYTLLTPLGVHAVPCNNNTGQGTPCVITPPNMPSGGWQAAGITQGSAYCNYGCLHHFVVNNNGTLGYVGEGMHTASCSNGGTSPSGTPCPPCQLVGKAIFYPSSPVQMPAAAGASVTLTDVAGAVGWYCQYGHFHYDPDAIVYQTVVSSNPQSAAVVNNTIPYSYTGSFENTFVYLDIPQHHDCTYQTAFRFQSTCINTSVTINGTVYNNFQSIDPETLLRNFNDDIAEALLPLHPEYCKLQFCNDGDFVNSVTNTETFAQAQAKSYFLLANTSLPANSQTTDCMVGNDLLYQNAASKADMYGKLTHLPGYNPATAYPANDPRGKTLERLALEMAYCGAGNAGEQDICRSSLYATQINAGVGAIINDDVRQRYWENLRSLYLVSHSYYRQKALDASGTSCPNCQDVRMVLTGTPAAPAVFSGTTGDIDPAAWDNVDAVDMQSLYGANSASVITNLLNSLPAPAGSISTPVPVAANQDNILEAFLAPVADALYTIGNNTAAYNTVKQHLAAVMAQGGEITPDMMMAEFAGVSLPATDRCNPYLLDYNLVRVNTEDNAPYMCGAQNLYSDLKDLVNSLLPVTSGTVTLQNTNSYAAKLITLLNGSPASSLNVSVTASSQTLSAGGTGYSVLWQYHFVYNNTATDLYISAVPDQAAVNTLPASFSAGYCISDRGVLNLGYLAKSTALLMNGANKYVVFCKDIQLMYEPADPQLAKAVNAWDIKQAATGFMNQQAAYGYTVDYAHPLFSTVFTNYVNYYLHKNYTFPQYEDLMKGCALSNQVKFPATIAPVLVSFTGASAATQAGSFLNFLKTLSDPASSYSSWRLGTDIVRFHYSDAAGNRYLYLDFGSVPANKYYQAKTLIAANLNGGTMSNVSLPVNEAAALLLPAGSQPLSFSGLNMTAQGTVTVYIGNSTQNFDWYTVNFNSGISLTDQSDALASMQQYIYQYLPEALIFYQSRLLRDNYSNKKAVYLNAIYNAGITTHADAVAAISTGNSTLVNALGGSVLNYTDPFCSGSIKDLFVYPQGNTPLNSGKLVTALSGYSQNLLTASGSVTAPATGLYRRQLRKADGAYWFVYIDYPSYGATDHGYKIYNAYILPPPGKDIAGYQMNLSSIVPAQSINGDVRAFEITLYNGSNSIVCKGYTDFAVMHSGDRLENVVLYEGANRQCYDQNDCEYQQLQAAVAQGTDQYTQYRLQTKQDIVNRFISFLQTPGNITEELKKTSLDNQYQYTLYFYDRAGNLMRTVPPADVTPLQGAALANVQTKRNSTDPLQQTVKLLPYKKASYYWYNSLNQLVQQSTPDGGVTKFYYDDKGRVSFSQNAKQQEKSGGGYSFYSYTLYDEQNRVTETGEAKIYEPALSQPAIITKMQNHELIANYADEVIKTVHISTKTDVVYTQYDEPTLDLAGINAQDYGLSAQENLRKRVAAVRYFSSLGYTALPGYVWWSAPDYAVHYSYDAEGNVKTLTHEIKRLSDVKQKYKRVDYEYDVLSGKVNLVSYNRGFQDQFYHRYAYDADNRVTKTETSNDGVIWSQDATYDYYKHGPLARVRIGDYGIQSMEYAYTLQGWLKAINGDLLNPNKDMGGSGIAAANADPIARDAIAHSLQYYNGDYKPIGNTPVENLPLAAANAPAALGSNQLYNGNIARQYTSIAGLNPIPNTPDMYYGMERTYAYDQLNRLMGATNNVTDNQSGSLIAGTNGNNYRTAYSYDEDGNIKNLQRWDGGVNIALASNTPTQIDNMTYDYLNIYNKDEKYHNQLQNVVENAPAAVAGYTDIRPFTPGNDKTYEYDKIGNLVKDRRDGLDITWNLYGKTNSVKKSVNGQVNTLNFSYDGMGNRLVKDNVSMQNGQENHDGEIYIRDAQGNILAVYKLKSQYARKEVIAQTNQQAMNAGATVLQLATMLKTVGDESPGFSAAALDLAMDQEPTWANDQVSAQPASFYILNDETTLTKLLENNPNYLDPLQEYINNNDTGSQAISFSIANSDRSQIGQFLDAAMGDDGAGPALIRDYGLYMPYQFTSLLWANYSDIPYDANDLDNQSGELYTFLKNHGTRGDASLYMLNSLYEVKPEAAQVFLDAIVQDNKIYRAPGLRGSNQQTTPFELNIMAMLQSQGDRDLLAGFFNQWQPALDYVSNNISARYKLGVIYNVQATDLLASLAGQNIDVINTALAGQSSVTLQEYANKVIASGITGAGAVGSPSSVSDELALAEHHIYGSSRLGVHYYDQVVNTWKNKWVYNNPGQSFWNLNAPNAWYSYSYGDLVRKDQRVAWNNWHDPANNSSNNNGYGGAAYFVTNRILGMTQYELTDHLGNVLATVLDRKLGHVSSSNTSLYDYYRADIMSAQDYYPFGMQMPGRFLNSDKSRFGFNGQMKDNEIAGIGNSLDFGSRVYDSRLSRFISIDPLTNKYPHYTPYLFAGNTPIQAVDLNGAAEYHYILTFKNDGSTLFILLGPPQVWQKHGWLPDTRVPDRYVIYFGKNTYHIGFPGAYPQNSGINQMEIFKLWKSAPNANTFSNLFYNDNESKNYLIKQAIEQARDNFLSILYYQTVFAPLRYALKPVDLDWRHTGKTWEEALDEAFKKTGVPKEEFKVTKWSDVKGLNGKNMPVEWRAPDGSEVNIDYGHYGVNRKGEWVTGPDAPHVGWQTGGKRGSGGSQTGHIILDYVPYGRSKEK